MNMIPYWDETASFAENNYCPMINYQVEYGWVPTFFGEDLLEPKWYETRIVAPDHLHAPLPEAGALSGT